MLDHVGNALEVRQASETQVRQFVADASHELRTPLAAIRGYAEVSRRGGQPVLANLLGNARTHTPEGTRVTVGVGVSGQEAVLRVTDNGSGIPAGLLPHAFERFARGNGSRSRAAGSTGLELAIVHAVVTARGGSVAVESAPGRTIFTVRLPTRITARSPGRGRRAGRRPPAR
jgi:two-component system OmpR family sensor kinase